MKPVAICKSMLSRTRSQYSSSRIPDWEDYLQENNIPYEYVNCYDHDIIKQLPKYSALLWHYSNFVISDIMEAQNILNVASEMGLKVFPDYHTGWHFDDKIAEMYALQSVGAPIPQSWVFYECDKCLKWLQGDAKYPLVAKLRCGSGANNVKKLNNYTEAVRYAKRMFSRGYQPAPSLVYKAYSKIQSTKDWKTFVNRFKRIPDFLHARHFAKQMPIEKGYCYFQEFIPNDGYDLKVAVVGDKCCGVVRYTRKGDFRASGAGDTHFKPELITKQIVNSAFNTADQLKLQCIGFDYVVNKATGKGCIIEMCFGNGVADETYEAGGYWDRQYIWHNEPLNLSIEIIKNLVNSI